jgi:hypothetical protein
MKLALDVTAVDNKMFSSINDMCESITDRNYRYVIM